jgi:hypothetical protein
MQLFIGDATLDDQLDQIAQERGLELLGFVGEIPVVFPIATGEITAFLDHQFVAAGVFPENFAGEDLEKVAQGAHREADQGGRGGSSHDDQDPMRIEKDLGGLGRGKRRDAEDHQSTDHA